MTGIPSGRFPPFWVSIPAAPAARVRARRDGAAAPPGRPGLGGQRDPPVNAWVVAARVALGHPAHATSVLARLRNMSFCRLRTCLKSAACAALKIRCRSRRTCASCWDHLMASQSGRPPVRSPRPVHPDRPSPAVGSPVAAPNLPIRFQRLVGSDSSKGHPAHVSTLTGPDTQVWYAASYTSTTVFGGFGHPSSLSCCLSAAAIRFLAVLSHPGSTLSLRSAYRRPVSFPPDLDGVSMFRTGRATGAGASCTPGPWCSHGRHRNSDHHCHLSAAGPVLRCCFHLPEFWLTRLAEVHLLRPSGLPLACNLRMERRSLGFLPGFTPHRYQ